MRLKLELLQLLAVVAAIALSNAVPLNRFDSDGNNLRLDRQNASFDIEFGSVCVIDDVLYQVGDYVPPTSPCERCICEPPTISCAPLPCDFKPNCKALKMSDQCCTVYQCECEHNGRVYQNGERLENPENPCNVCYCRGGEVSCTAIECYRRDDCEPQYVPGRCCPKYDHCPPIDQPRLEKTRPQFIRTDYNRDSTASVDPTVQQRNGLFDLDNEASEDVTATAVTTATLEQHLNSTSTGSITVKLQPTDASPVFGDEHHDISVKQNIGDEVRLTADDSETLLSESRIVPVAPKLIPVTQEPREDKVPSTTSSFSSEEGSGTTSLNLNDGPVSSSTESLEAGSKTKLELDVSSGDGEGSGTQEPEQQTESNIHTTLGDDNPQVLIISGTSESVESNEVTDSTTVDYSRTITRKQLPESTKLDEQFTTVTEIPRTSPIEDIKTESFLVNGKSSIGATSFSGEIDTVTDQNIAHQTSPSEYFTTTVTDSNEVTDEGRTTQHFDIKLRISSDELSTESEESKEKKPNSSEEGSSESSANDTKLQSTTITDQDISESKTNPTDISPTEAASTTLPEGDHTSALVNSSEVKRVHIISSSSAVRVYNAEKDNTQQETATESFINLENEFPILPIGSVLMNNEMDVVLATTEAAQLTNSEETSTTFSLLREDAEKLTPTEIVTEETSSEHLPGVAESLHQEEVAAGSYVYQKLVLETVNSTEVTTVEEDQNSRDITTAVPVLIKSASLLASQSGDETDNIPPTTTELNLQDETTENKVQQSAISTDEDLTTLASELEEITAFTESFESADGGKSTATSNLEESTTVLPETVGNMDHSHSQLAEIKVRHAVDSVNTEESTTTFTEAPKLARTGLDEFSTPSAGHEFKESEETTTEHSLIETTTDNTEAFIQLASNPSNIKVETANSEAIGTTRYEDVTESNDKALLRDASSVQLQSATEQPAEVETTTFLRDDELSSTNNDHVRTEIYQQETTEASGSHDAVTELPEIKQYSGLNDEPNDSSNTADFSTTTESVTQNDNAKETTSVPEVLSLLGEGSSNLEEKVAVKLLEEQTTDLPKADNQELTQAGESSTTLDNLTTKLSNEDEFSTASLPVETSTLLSEESEQKESFSESEAPKSITVSSGESFTTLPTSSGVDMDESTTYSAEETTLKGVHSTTPQSSGAANIKREIAASEHASNQPEQGTENPTTSEDSSLPQHGVADISSTEEVGSSEGAITEISNLNLNNSHTHEKLEFASFKEQEIYTSTPEISTTLLEDSTQQYAESSTKLYVEDVTDVFRESGEKKEELARVVHNVAVAGDVSQNDTEIESTTLPRDWLKSDNSSEITETPILTSEIVTGADAKEYTTVVTDVQESLVTEETTRPTAAEEDKSVGTNTLTESNSTKVNTNVETDESSDVANPEHTVKARSVDNFDINSGNDNSFIRPGESVLPNIEYHSSLNDHIVRDPENFRAVEDFFSRLFHPQDDDDAVI